MATKDKKTLTFGVLLLILGIIFLLTNIRAFSLDKTWPILPLFIGIGFIIAFASNRQKPDLLIPGTILIVISVLFFYCSFTDWAKMVQLWPIFLIAPALGFYLVYFLGPRNKALLMPASVLLLIGVLFFVLDTLLSKYWPIILILVGAGIVLKQYLQRPASAQQPQD